MKIKLSLLIIVALIAFCNSCKKEPETPKTGNKIVIGITTTDSTSNYKIAVSTQVTSLSGNAIQQHGYCWGTAANPDITGNHSSLGSLSNAGKFSEQITALNPGTKYYIRPYLTYSYGILYGQQLSDTTKKTSKPIVILESISDITSSTAIASATVSADGGVPVTLRGVCWNFTGNPTLTNCIKKTEQGSGTGAFSASMTNLLADTTYYVCAYATNAEGTSYSTPPEHFKTPLNVTFNIDMTAVNLFDPSHNDIYIAGDLASGWTEPGTDLRYKMSPTTGNALIYTITLQLSRGSYSYKFFRVVDAVASWDYGEWAGHPDRTISVTAPMTIEVPWASCPDIILVPYGGQEYHTVQINNQCWFKENLNIGNRINGSLSQKNNGIIEKYCYTDNESACNTYGGLYQWGEMMQYVTTTGSKGICPDGWHLPSFAEWDTLSTHLSGVSVAGGKLKEAGTLHWLSPNTGATNISGFTALPGGNRHISGTFYFLTTFGYFWSASETSSAASSGRMFSYQSVSVDSFDYDKTYGFSVRCIHN